MAKLIGIREYRFVVPVIVDGKATWVHPSGWWFNIISDQASEDAHADLQDRWLVRCRDAVKLCSELGHTATGGCQIQVSGEWLCERRARLAAEVTRTAERTMLIVVDIPLPDDQQLRCKACGFTGGCACTGGAATP